MEIEDLVWERGEIDSKIFDKLRINKAGFLESDTHRQCTNCWIIFEKYSATMKICRVCNSGRVKTQSPVMKMWRRAKARAAKKNMEFTIIPDDILIPRECPVLGIPLYVTVGKPGAYMHSPSLDRIDSTKGYTKDNTQVISQLANAMKSKATEEQLVRFAQWVLLHYRDINIEEL